MGARLRRRRADRAELRRAVGLSGERRVRHHAASRPLGRAPAPIRGRAPAADRRGRGVPALGRASLSGRAGHRAARPLRRPRRRRRGRRRHRPLADGRRPRGPAPRAARAACSATSSPASSTAPPVASGWTSICASPTCSSRPTPRLRHGTRSPSSTTGSAREAVVRLADRRRPGGGRAQAGSQAGVAELVSRCVVSVDGRDAAVPPDALADALSEPLAALDPQAELVIDVSCPACDEPMTALVDAATVLLAELTASDDRLLREVDAIARVYHWSEDRDPRAGRAPPAPVPRAARRRGRRGVVSGYLARLVDRGVGAPGGTAGPRLGPVFPLGRGRRDGGARGQSGPLPSSLRSRRRRGLPPLSRAMPRRRRLRIRRGWQAEPGRASAGAPAGGSSRGVAPRARSRAAAAPVSQPAAPVQHAGSPPGAGRSTPVATRHRPRDPDAGARRTDSGRAASRRRAAQSSARGVAPTAPGAAAGRPTATAVPRPNAARDPLPARADRGSPAAPEHAPQIEVRIGRVEVRRPPEPVPEQWPAAVSQPSAAPTGFDRLAAARRYVDRRWS